MHVFSLRMKAMCACLSTSTRGTIAQNMSRLVQLNRGSYLSGVEQVEIYAIDRSQYVHSPFQIHLSFPARPWLVQMSPFPLSSYTVPERQGEASR